MTRTASYDVGTFEIEGETIFSSGGMTGSVTLLCALPVRITLGRFLAWLVSLRKCVSRGASCS
jgi:hypothetical protein